MKETIHYLLMANHLLFKKELFSWIRDTDLTLGQPKVLDYLFDHDGAIQKDIAAACVIDPASLTVLLRGMEEKGLIYREMHGDDRRAFQVRMTDRGREYALRVHREFDEMEEIAFSGLTAQEKETLRDLLIRLHEKQIEYQ